jgi:hypothetical protein
LLRDDIKAMGRGVTAEIRNAYMSPFGTVVGSRLRKVAGNGGG